MITNLLFFAACFVVAYLGITLSAAERPSREPVRIAVRPLPPVVRRRS